jgi:putative proteasome-type protease
MTYCVGMRLNAGLVFLSDSRTNAGVDQVGTFRKLSVFEIPGDRMMVMMTAGNLSISQSIRQLVRAQDRRRPQHLECAEYVRSGAHPRPGRAPGA